MIFLLFLFLGTKNVLCKADDSTTNSNIDLKHTKFSSFSEKIPIFSKIKTDETIRIFNERLDRKVHTDSTIVRFQMKYERIILVPEVYVKVVDSMFSNCKTDNTGVGSNGGAIFADIFTDPNSYFVLFHVCFDKCSAYSSGGAIFMTGNSVYQSGVAYSNCQAQTGQSFSLFSYSSTTNLTKVDHCGHNKNKHHTYNKVQTLGGSYHLYEENNVTRNSVNGFAAFMYFHYFNYINISYCIMSRNTGENGFFFADERKNVLLEKSFVYGNNFEKTSIFTNSAIDISKCWYEIMRFNLTNRESSHLVSFMECVFNSKKDEMMEFVNSETIADSEYEVETLPVLPNINPKCWFSEEKVKPAKKADKSTKVVILFILAFISGACAVYAIMSRSGKNEGKKKVHAFEGKYLARI